ncbi:ATP-dependent DNA helicase PIF1 [Mycena kentingensis (nom. inval.)]|nr:ATP-dependent DNA helicase PIF1 [Mycena kentingensis (nom. inval.)]
MVQRFLDAKYPLQQPSVWLLSLVKLRSNLLHLVSPPDGAQNADVDAQILEALSGKDRIYVLKLGEGMEALIHERRQRLELNPATTYQRMLVHRCAAYYALTPETDLLTKAISVVLTAESRIPARRIADLSPPPVETTTPPKFKIMMRKPMSQASSVTGDDGDVSDVEASETGSLGGRSSVSAASKPRMTIEERTAAYNEARNRIFIDFDEKDQSSASSSASLVSGSSTSASGDEPGSPATESEWSGPSTKKQPPHRANRSSAPAFMSSNTSSSSSRNSRAPSPAFKYATLYEPPPPGGMSIALPSYDGPHNVAPGFQGAAPTSFATTAYGVLSLLHPPTDAARPHTSVPILPTIRPILAPVDAQLGPRDQNGGTPPPPPPAQNPNHMNGSPPPMPQYNAYPVPHPHTPSPPSGYAAYEATPTNANLPYAPGQPSFYNHGPPHPMSPYMSPPPPPPPQMQQTQSFEAPRANGGRHNSNGNGNGNGNGQPQRRNGNINGINGNGNGKGRGGVAPPQRSAWSFGPGISAGGVDFPSGGSSSAYPPPVGPRLSGSMYGPGMGMRRGSSGNRTTSGSGSSAGDDVSSVASSSTTSSSSRRTYTSTASSQQHHPLPARPDWAVGLRPTPTLHAARHRDHDGRDSTRSSNSGNSSPHGHGPAPPAMTDFPPLSNGPGAGMGVVPRAPAPAGAWTNASSTRSIVMAQQAGGSGSGSGSALVTHGDKVELKGPVALMRRPTNGKEKERERERAVMNAIMVNQVAAISLDDVAAAPSAPAPVLPGPPPGTVASPAPPPAVATPG